MRAEISALMDDDLEGDGVEKALDSLDRDAGLRRAWGDYHMIGDSLRRTDADLAPDFTARVMERLAAEPTVLAPAPARRRSVLRVALPLAASLMGVGAVAWVALSLNAPAPVQIVTIQAPAATPAVAPLAPAASAPVAQAPQRKTEERAETVAVSVPQPSQVREYLMAHQGYSPGMNGVANYVRSVSESRPSEAR